MMIVMMMMMMCAVQEDSGMSPVKENHVTSHVTAVRRQSTSDRVVDRLERRHSRMAVTRRNLRRSLPNREYATLVSQPHRTRGRSQKSNSNSDIFLPILVLFVPLETGVDTLSALHRRHKL